MPAAFFAQAFIGQKDYALTYANDKRIYYYQYSKLTGSEKEEVDRKIRGVAKRQEGYGIVATLGAIILAGPIALLFPKKKEITAADLIETKKG